VDAGTPALLVTATDGPMLPEMTGLARRIAGTGASVYGIGGDHDFAAACRSALPGPSLPEHLAPFALVVPARMPPAASTRSPRPTPDPPARSEPPIGATVGAAVSPRRPDAAWTA
jgi:glucosamine--fructose-6-phosphate aminotransferase (isomerizing)